MLLLHGNSSAMQQAMAMMISCTCLLQSKVADLQVIWPQKGGKTLILRVQLPAPG